MQFIKLVCCSLLLLLFGCSSNPTVEYEQVMLKGIVVDRGTNAPAPDVRVRLLVYEKERFLFSHETPEEFIVMTGRDGRFRVWVPRKLFALINLSKGEKGNRSGGMDSIRFDDYDPDSELILEVF